MSLNFVKTLMDPEKGLAIFQSAIREEVELHRIEGRPIAVLRNGKVEFVMVDELEEESKRIAS